MIVALLALIALALVYLFIIRPILKKQPALSAAFKAEASFGEKLQAKITGWRTKIVARLLIIGGLLSGFYSDLLPLATMQDWSPLTAKVPAWSIPIGLVVIGYVFEKLRKMTDNPPVIVTQKDDAGDVKVVGLIPPVKA